MKKLFFTLTLCFSFLIISSSVFAENNDNSEKDPVEQKVDEEKLDKKLEKLGFPEDYLAILSIEQKQDIIDSDPVRFDGVEKKSFYLDEDGNLREINPDEITTMGTIPSEELTLWNGKTYIGNINGRATYRIYVNWEWDIVTNFNYEDKIALSYNEDFQTRVSNNGKYACGTSEYEPKTGEKVYSTDCYGRPSDISYGGAAWYFDKRAAYRNAGWAAMDIETKDNTSPTGTAIVLSKLIHKTGFDGGIGLSIGFVSIDVSNSSGYDEAAAQTSWYY